MKKLLIVLGILFILEHIVVLSFLAIGFWDPFKYGEESEIISKEIVETFFVDWDQEYLKSKYNKDVRDSRFIDRAVQRLSSIEDKYGAIKEIKKVKRTGYDFTVP